MSAPVIAVVAVVGGVLVLALWWVLPKVQARGWPADLDPKDRVELENNARATVGQLIGAVGVVATIAITLISLNETNRNTERTLDLSSSAQIDERFARAIDKLSARDGDRRTVESRIGGIYLLRQFAIEDGATRGRVNTVTDVLSAYIRTNSPRNAGSADPGRLPRRAPCLPGRLRVSPDIQAALDTLREMHPAGKGEEGSYINLTGADLSGADLSGLNLNFADMRDARLVLTHLAGATLFRADLGGVDGRRACFSDVRGENAFFRSTAGADRDLPPREAADLRGASFEAAHLPGVVFIDADLRGANLRGGRFENALVRGARLEGANDRDALCRDANSC